MSSHQLEVFRQKVREHWGLELSKWQEASDSYRRQIVQLTGESQVPSAVPDPAELVTLRKSLATSELAMARIRANLASEEVVTQVASYLNFADKVREEALGFQVKKPPSCPRCHHDHFSVDDGCRDCGWAVRARVDSLYSYEISDT